MIGGGGGGGVRSMSAFSAGGGAAGTDILRASVHISATHGQTHPIPSLPTIWIIGTVDLEQCVSLFIVSCEVSANNDIKEAEA